VKLTPTEFRLFAYLMERADTPISLDELLENVWGHLPGTGAAEVVRAHVFNLRHKMAALGGSARLLRTLPHRGYCLSRGERA
jgi:DNA-binding response OmpR family regulator